MTEGVRPTAMYKTLAEQREVLTSAEQTFEKARQTTGTSSGNSVPSDVHDRPLALGGYPHLGYGDPRAGARRGTR